MALATEPIAGETRFGARLWGTLRLRVAAYRDIATAPEATRQALRIVLGVALFRVLVRTIARLGRGADTALLPQGYGIPAGYAFDLPHDVNPALLFAGQLGVAILLGLLVWSSRTRMLRLATRLVLGERLPRAPFLRLVGYGDAFGVLGVVPLVGPLLSLVFTTVATMVGVRAVTRASVGKAILTGLLALVFTVLFIALIAAVVTITVLVILRSGH